MAIHVIVNANAPLARNERALTLVSEKFGDQLHAITKTACAQEAVNIARCVASRNIDTLVVVGGDGTVNSVLSAVAGTNMALGIVPNGTANDLSSLFALPTDIATACDVIRRRRLQTVDLIEVNSRYFVTGGGLGLPARVAAMANALKLHNGSGRTLHGLLGSKLYVASAVSALLAKGCEASSIAIFGGHGWLVADALSLTISNQPFVGRHFYVSPGADNNDGLFDVCLIEKSRHRLQSATTLARVLRGSHAHLPRVRTWRGEELIVRAEKSLPFFADGEHLEDANVFSIKILPKSLNLIVPEDNGHLENIPVRQRNDHAFGN